MARPNVFDGEFPIVRADAGMKGKPFAREAGARELGGTLYELEPGSTGTKLHAHYGNEELFVVLDGSPTLRTHEGEEQLARGDVVACVRGREGTHTFENRSQEPVLLLALSTKHRPDVAVYPETDEIAVVTRDPFAPVPDGEDEGVIALFATADNRRTPPA
jgi:uncharacterized cupin superfamily protein